MKYNYLFRTLSIFIFLLNSFHSFAQSPNVLTDTTDYSPGDTAIITGTGFVPFDTITVQVIHTQGSLPDSDYAEHQPWLVTADSSGTFSTYWVVPHDAFGTDLVVTAVGETGSDSAAYYFYDALGFDNFQSRRSGNWNNKTTWIKGLHGTSVKFTNGSANVTGSGTKFTTDLSVGDSLMLQLSSGTVRGAVASITDSMHLTLTAAATATDSGAYGKQAWPTSSDGTIEIIRGDTVTVTATVSSNQLTIDTAAQLTVNSADTLTFAIAAYSYVYGTMNINGYLYTDSAAYLTIETTGILNINDTAYFGKNNTLYIYGGNVNIAAGGYLNMNSSGTTLDEWGNITAHGNGYISAGGELHLGTITLADSSIFYSDNNFTLGTPSAGPTVLIVAPKAKVTGSGNFTMLSGATLETGNTAGITSSGATGNIQNTGSRSYPTGANYIYNGTAAQVTGNGLPTGTITGNITDSNAIGLTPTNSIAISGTLTVTGLLTPTASQTISGSGTLTGSGTVQVTRTASTADFSSQYTITNKTLANITVNYAGTAAQTVSAITYGNLQINNGSNVTLGGNTTVNGTLTFTSGKISTGSYMLSFDSTASVTGASSGQYIYGSVQWNIPAGSPSHTFNVGDASNYAPVTLAFTNVTTPGTITITTTSGNEPNIATSGIDSTKDVKRYWTLTNSATAFTSFNATFNYVSGDIQGGANPSYFILEEYNPSTWSQLTTGTLATLSSQATGMTGFGYVQIGYPICTHSGNPTSVTATHDTICNGSSDTLTLNGGGGGTYQTIHWYTGSCGGTSVGTGNTLPVSPAATTTYYGGYVDTTACSYNSSCVSVTVTVLPLSTWYRDYDGDGYGNPKDSLIACIQPSGYVSNNTDCNDSNAAVHSPQTYYADIDQDGYLDSLHNVFSCGAPSGAWTTGAPAGVTDSSGHWQPMYTLPVGTVGDSILLPDGFSYAHYYTSTNAATIGAETQPRLAGDHLWDCNDSCVSCLTHQGGLTTSYIHPGAQELCNGIDDNCNGIIDGDSAQGDGLTQATYYIDADEDDYGNPSGPTIQSCAGIDFMTTNLVGGQYVYIPDGSGAYRWSLDNTDCNDNPLTHGYDIHVAPPVALAGTLGSLLLCSGAAATLHPYVKTTPIEPTWGDYVNDSLFYNLYSADSAAANYNTPYQEITYVWSNGATTEDITISSAGTYSVTVTQFGCTGSDTVHVSVNPTLSVTSTVTANVSCYGGSNGAATVSASGGTSPYAYSWSNEATTTSVTGLAVGTYTVTVTDVNGCAVVNTATITQPTALTVNAGINQTICTGDSVVTGGSPTASGGTSSYIYSWSPSTGLSSSAVANPKASPASTTTYTVTVTDANGCYTTSSAMITVNSKSANPTSAIASPSTICNSQSTTLTLSGGGGGSSETIHWYTSSCGGTSVGTGNGISVSPPTTTTYYGLYEDGSPCSYSTSCESITVTVTPQPTWYRDYDGDGYGNPNNSVTGCSQPSGYISDNTDCNDSNAAVHSPQTYYADIDQDGFLDSLHSVVSCGEPSRAWTTGAPAGVTDSSGYWLPMFTLPVGVVGDSILISTGDVNGPIYARYYTSAYEAIVGFEKSPRLAGDHLWDCNDTCTLCAAAGSPGEIPYYIHPGALELCNGIDDNCNGYIDDSLHDGLSRTVYYIDEDKDGFGNPAGPTTLSCAGIRDITTNLVDGQYVFMPYSNGIYYMTTDSTDCNDNPATGGNDVHIPPTVELAGGLGSVLLCSGASGVLHPYVRNTPFIPADGNYINDSLEYNLYSADSATAEGNTPYEWITYLWSNASTTEDITVSAAGTYSVTVTQFGCIGSDTVHVSANPTLSVTATVTANVSCYGGSNGAATVSASGGTSPYYYSWSEGATTTSVTGLAAGTYTVTVTDANGCSVTSNATVALVTNYTWNGIGSSDFNNPTNWTPNGVPTSCDTITIVTGSNNALLNSNVTINSLTINSGVLNLQSYSLSVTNNITINSSATLNAATSGAALSLGGTWSNNGTFSAGSSTVTFSGGVAQSINGTSTTAFNNLTINKTSGNVTLGEPLTITDTLTLAKGIILTDTSNFITIPNSGVAIGGSDSSYIAGPMEKTGNNAFTFPLGDITLDSGAYHPLSISAPSSTSDAFTAQYFAQGSGIANTIDSIEVSNCEYWKLEHSYGSSSVIISIGWNLNCYVGINSKKIVAANIGSLWLNLGQGSIDSTDILGSISSNTSLLIPTSHSCTVAAGFVLPWLIAYLSDVEGSSCTTNNGKATAAGLWGIQCPPSPYHYNYLWSTGATTAAISGLAPDNYSVQVSDCEGASFTLTVQIGEYCDETACPDENPQGPPAEWWRDDYAASTPSVYYGASADDLSYVFPNNADCIEDWWYGLTNSNDAGVPDGYVACGYTILDPFSYDEGCYANSASSNDDCIGKNPFAEAIGCSSSSTSTYLTQTIAKFDLNGNREWWTFGEFGELFKIIQTHDGNYLAVGRTENTVSSATGNPIPYYDFTNQTVYHNITCSTPYSYPRRAFLIKIDPNGWILWEDIFGIPTTSATSGETIQNMSAEGHDVVEYYDGSCYKYRLVGFDGIDYHFNADNAVETGLIIDVNENGTMNWMDEEPGQINEIYLRGIAKYPSSGTTTAFAISGYEDVPNEAPNATLLYYPSVAEPKTIKPSIERADYNYNPNGGNAFNWNVAFDNSGNIILPVQEDQVGTFANQNGEHCEESIYKINPSPELSLIGSQYQLTGYGKNCEGVPTGIENTDEQMFGYDLRPGVTATSDGGFAFVSSKRPLTYDTEWGSLSWSCTGGDQNSSDYQFFNSRGYVAKFNSSLTIDWDKLFDINGETAPNNSVSSDYANGYPIDYKKKQCLSGIVQSPYDGGLVVAGDDSWRSDDDYLVKFYDDCESNQTTYDVDVISGDVNSIFGSDSYTISSSLKVRGSIHILNGQTLTISGSDTKVYFADTRRVDLETDIVVEQGGTLNVIDGAELTSIQTCTANMYDGNPHTMWDGIKVLGQGSSSYEAQTTGSGGNAGLMQINSGATISNAVFAVLVDQGNYFGYVDQPVANEGDLLHDNLLAYSGTGGGGVLYAYGATFRNNRRSIIFDPYFAADGSNNLSYIFNCTFTNSGPLADIGYTYFDAQTNTDYPEGNNVFLTMWGVRGINIGDETTFTGSEDFAVGSRGFGIIGFDANFSVTNCTFSYNSYAISAGASNPMNNFNATYNTFTKNSIGIQSTAIDGAVIKDNTFDVGDGGVVDIGIWLDNCTDYTVSDNLLSTTDALDFEDGHASLGLNINFGSPNQNTNEIYRNSFGYATISGTTPGNFAFSAYTWGYLNQTGEGPPAQGLVLRCNNYTLNAFDEYTPIEPGIAGSQGSPLSPADNQFDVDGCMGSNTNGQTDGELYNYDANGGITTYTYYYDDYSNVGYSIEPISGCYTSATITLQGTHNLFLYSSACPDHTTIAELEARIDSDPPAADSLQNIIDGGNTAGLLDTIATADTTSIISSLTAVLPYLSDSVIIATINQGAMSGYSVVSILRAVVPVSAAVMSALETRLFSLDSTEIATLIGQNDTSLSPTDSIKSAITYYKSDKELAVNELMQLFFADTTFNGTDSVIALLRTQTGSNRQYQLAGAYLIKNDTAKADSVLSVLSADTTYTNFCKLQNIMRNPVPSSQGGIDSLVLRLDSLANDTVHYGAYGARATISFLTGKVYPPVIVFPSMGEGRKTRINKIQLLTGQKSMLIYPNPTNSQATVEANVPSNSTSQELVLTDVLGQQVEVYSLQAGYNSLTISLSSLKSGLYFVHLLSDKNVIASDRLLKIN